jgi:hypothetical protein
MGLLLGIFSDIAVQICIVPGRRLPVGRGDLRLGALDTPSLKMVGRNKKARRVAGFFGLYFYFSGLREILGQEKAGCGGADRGSEV